MLPCDPFTSSNGWESKYAFSFLFYFIFIFFLRDYGDQVYLTNEFIFLLFRYGQFARNEVVYDNKMCFSFDLRAANE